MQALHRLRYPAADHVSGAPGLVAEGLTVYYNTTPALLDVSFAIGLGERVAVVGPNGAGKSTLFKVIAGILRPTAGTLRVFGHPPGAHLCIGYVPQRSQIDWSFPVTVTDVVMMGRSAKIGLFRWPRRRDWAIVHRALRQVDMDALADRPIGELSGGQQQRVFLARALAQEAEILLLDEPLTGLDTPGQETLFAVLDRLREQGIIVLVATHDLDQAAAHFDRVMLLNRRLIALGSPAEVLTPPHLLRAYGAHLHILPGEDETPTMVLADTCCEGAERRP
jgi:manganese/iron transport system ATP-binding protein